MSRLCHTWYSYISDSVWTGEGADSFKQLRRSKKMLNISDRKRGSFLYHNVYNMIKWTEVYQALKALKCITYYDKHHYSRFPCFIYCTMQVISETKTTFLFKNRLYTLQHEHIFLWTLWQHNLGSFCFTVREITVKKMA